MDAIYSFWATGETVGASEDYAGMTQERAWLVAHGYQESDSRETSRTRSRERDHADAKRLNESKK